MHRTTFLQRPRHFFLFTLLLSLVLVMAACAPAAAPADNGAAAPETAEEADASADTAAGGEEGPQYGGTMVWTGHQEVAGLAPDDLGPTVHEVILYNIYNPLVSYNEYAELEPVLAESFEVSDDGLTYTFNLHEGVLFHNGEELTSEDVKYTFDYYRDPDNASTRIGDFNGIESIETPDEYTVVVNMVEVNAASLDTWGSFPIGNAAHHQEVGHEGYRTDPVGTGAFQLVSFSPAETVELAAFEEHFRGRPYIDVLRQDVVPEPSVRMIALQTGEADSAVWPLLPEDSLLLEEDPNFVVFRTLNNSIKHFPLNITLPQLADKQVRKAMMHALDRQRIIDDLWSGTAEIAHSNLTPKNAFYYNPDLPQYEFDPELAQQMLDEAGWTDEDGDGVRECNGCATAEDGTPLSFTITTITGDQARRPIAELAQVMLADVGVEVQLAEAPVSAILEAMRNQTMDASLFNWTYGSTPEPDPFGTLHPDGGSNFTGIDNPRLTELVEQGTTLVDPDERQPVYYEIQEIFVDEVPALYLQIDQNLNVFSSRIKGLPEDPLSSDEIYYDAHEFWIDEN